jgi:hypothetical protein
MNVHDELERVWEDRVVSYFKVKSSPGRTEENY